MLANLFHIIRWPNLIIIAILQSLVYYRLLDTNLSVLQPIHFALLSLVTIIIAASGYVINDYFDSARDQINRPQRWIAGNIWTLRQVKILYIVLVIAGGGLAIYLGLKLGLQLYILIYPVAVAGLWLYSYGLKCKPIAGNMWVALFCAGVIWAIALPDLLLDNKEVIKSELWFYMLFAFLATWYREVVKDLEDVEGDKKTMCQTFIVRYGQKPGRIMALFFAILLLVSLFWWEASPSGQAIEKFLFVLQGFIVASMCFVGWAKDQKYFHHASTVIKLVMLAGTILLLRI